jgi:hypothetical protein
MQAFDSAVEYETNAVTKVDADLAAALERNTVDLCCAGHTAYVADMSTCLNCREQFCAQHDCSCPVKEDQ